MDPVTHTLTGIGIASLVNRNIDNSICSKVSATKTKRAVLWVIVLGAIAPDIDILFSFLGSFEYFVNHRGITHSPPGLIVLALIISFTFSRIFREVSFIKLFTMALVGGISHVAFDLLTVYSTQAFWPFTENWYSFSLISIVDPFIIVLYSLAILITISKKHLNRKVWVTAFTILLIYIGSRGLIQANLMDKVSQEFDNKPIEKVSVMPTFSFNNWSYIVDHDDSFQMGKVSFLGGNIERERKVEKPQLSEYIETALETNKGKALTAFSPFLMIDEEAYGEHKKISLKDLRFSNAGGRILGAEIIIDSEGQVVEKVFLNFE